jgi:hypothetical protein
MIEDVLAEMSAGGFVVSNTFQTAEGDAWVFGPTGWKVYIRNVRNTRTGHGESDTLEGAFRAAVAKANEGPTYERPQRAATAEAPTRRTSGAFIPSPPKLTLGDESDSLEGDLF